MVSTAVAARPGPVRGGTGTGWPRLVVALFTTTSFSGAALLFVVQPMVARLVLPQYGGSATVWSTSSLFFQVVLLLGYLYTHGTSRWWSGRLQPWLHFGVLLLPLAALPVVLPADSAPSADVAPALWLLRTLALLIGLPFAVLSTTGPLLQRWYAASDGPRAHDPYFLFAAGNIGSFVGLLAYPLVIEPLLSVEQQRLWWSAAFVVFIVLIGACGAMVVRAGGLNRGEDAVRPPHTEPGEAGSPLDRRDDAGAPISPGRFAGWFALAFLPSSLMLGVTAHISTDVAAIPLLWVVPLALYLATFVVAFGRTGRDLPTTAMRAAVALAVVAGAAWFVKDGLLVPVQVALDLALLATAAYAAHARLAAQRPDPRHLTAYFLVIAAGGATGGVVNGLLAPLLLDRVWEFPAAVVAVALLGVGAGRPAWRRLSSRYHPAFVGLLETLGWSAVVIALTAALVVAARLGPAVLVGGLAVCLVVARVLARRPVAVAGGLAVTFLVLTFAAEGQDLDNSRTFYGTYRVLDQDGRRVLVHGITNHGAQRLAAPTEPQTYYVRGGPVGQLFDRLPTGDRVGVVGLGAGSLAAYGRPGQSMTFFEIDPEVVRIASDPSLFTFLERSAADIRTVAGDGRLQVAAVPDGEYDLLVLDAFSSDAIPVHLLTREAFETYARKLRPGGTLVVHISNKVFDLEPVVQAAATHLGWSAALGTGTAAGGGIDGTTWVVLSRDPDVLAPLVEPGGWRPLRDRSVVWTDDYSSVLGIMRGVPGPWG